MKTFINRLAGVAFALALIIPLFSPLGAAAQNADSSNAGGSAGTTPTTCTSLNLTRNLNDSTATSIRSAGADVKRLQVYLVSRGFLTATPNGFYTTATKRAVAQLQAAVGISPAAG